MTPCTLNLLRSLAAAAVAGFAAAAWAAPPSLQGTLWQLQAIESPDDRQGVTTVTPPSRFTIEFGRDGRASLQLDCNRGSGPYTVSPAGDAASGSLQLGPIATTRRLCAPGSLAPRVERDLPHIRSYLLRDGQLHLSLMADGGIYHWVPAGPAGQAPDPDRVVRPLGLGPAAGSVTVHGRISGRQFIDYHFRGGAGQGLAVHLAASHGALSFNLLPPGSRDAAMAIGELSDHRHEGLLPDDGVYTVRVFLLRSAARRNETGTFTLTARLSGLPLQPLPPRTDALLPGTRFHARATGVCQPAYAARRDCEVRVVRRGVDGTATVEWAWDGEHTRRVLFIRGEPRAADTAQTMTASRTERGWRLSFGGDEHVEVEDALLTGG